MNSDKTNAKNRIFQATLEILAGEDDIDKITSRQIAQKANVNLALINYYFQSKENLLNLVGMSMMEKIIGEKYIANNPNTSPEDRLRDILISTADFAFKYHKIFSVVVTVDIKQGCKNSCHMIMPLLKEIFKEKTQSQLDIISIQLLIPFQNILVYPKAYGALLSTDFFDDAQRTTKINEMINNILK